MFESLKYIELSGEKFPIKCDMVVLEKIQEEYGNLDLFEGKTERIYTEPQGRRNHRDQRRRADDRNVWSAEH